MLKLVTLLLSTANVIATETETATETATAQTAQKAQADEDESFKPSLKWFF